MLDDPIVAEVRQVREQLAARFDFDVQAIFADLRRRQVELGDRLVRRPARAAGQHPETPGPAAPAFSPG